MVEFETLFMEEDRPGAVLRAIGASPFAYILPPPLFSLIGVKQSAEWHPEGDAFVHTTHVMDAMARICVERNIAEGSRLVLSVAAMCHDFGKAVTTRWHPEKKKWVAYGHDEAGVPIADEFIREHLCRFVRDKAREKVLALVRWHMVHTRGAKDHTPKAANKLVLGLLPASYDELLLLMEADTWGRPPLPGGLPDHIARLTDLVRVVEANGLPGV